MSISAYADEFFTNKQLKDLRVIEVDKDQGKVRMKDKDGNEAEIKKGDKVGSEKGVVVTLDDAAITVKTGKTNTKIPMKSGVGKSQ